MKKFLGLEFGSTRIKAVLIDEKHATASSGDYTWKSSFENGVWTYPLEEAWVGLKAALRGVEGREDVAGVGVSGMMHGYLAFDKDWKLLTPFRTWQNTMTAQSAEELTNLFGFNIPQRWSIAHLYQAILNGEEHISRVAHITTLAGYIHHALTGVNAVGVGEASGMFPIDDATGKYNEAMLDKFDAHIAAKNLPWKIRDVLPTPLMAGKNAGTLTKEGAALLDGLLAEGVPFAPPEGDVGTGMTATNAVAPRTGNVSAGTSIFAMVVLERPLKNIHPEIDIVATPEGRPAAMVHCNNCTNDINAWVGMLRETAEMFGAKVSTGDLYTMLYKKSLEGAADCDGVLVYNYMAGESVTHLDSGRPLVMRRPDSSFTLANFMRSQIYGTMATMCIGMELLHEENVAIDSLTGHGGLFKTPGVGQRYMAAACKAPVTCMETAGEGGPYGMALLAAYMVCREAGESLSDYLKNKVFAGAKGVTLAPDEADVKGFEAYLANYTAGLAAEEAAVKAF
ncbi:MAG TPA: ATPase [Candidatus Pullichristensenella stercorigallinarum]|uniref:ATPase n=1 Tax=Candidatus Pullichristensenella stercorigallinarum TaxID=2840909 RepID=A0A9D1CVQ5_9FIRM|nr:ATPase [Candidatus Pullichristensenella stercorigallinarum]